MKLIAFLFALVFFQSTVFKPSDEFEVKLDYKFKQRPAESTTIVHLNDTEEDRSRRDSSTPLPYLILKINLLQLKNAETKCVISTNRHERLATKKITVGSTISLDMGFTDDIKDRITASEYKLTFIDVDKKAVNTIVINVDEDGNFTVNNEKRGKF